MLSPETLVHSEPPIWVPWYPPRYKRPSLSSSIPDSSSKVIEAVTDASALVTSISFGVTVKLENVGKFVSGSESLLLISLPIPEWIEQ